MSDQPKQDPINEPPPQPPAFPEPQHFPEANIVSYNGPSVPQGSFGPPEPVPAPHVQHSYMAARFTCVRCGSMNLAKGTIVDYGDKFEQVRFAPKRIKISWLNSLFNLRPWRGLLKLEAVACRDCGAVLTVVDPDDLRRAERRREY
jgi:hypothetical protein